MVLVFVSIRHQYKNVTRIVASMTLMCRPFIFFSTCVRNTAFFIKRLLFDSIIRVIKMEETIL